MKKHVIMQLVVFMAVFATFNVLVAKAEEETSVPTLAVCDHNNDGFRNLSDVSRFAQCKDTFDVNGDGVHDLTDISLYAENNQNGDFCAQFVCVAVPPVLPTTSEEPAVLAICDHNGDGFRNLTDVSMFAQCQDTFDINGDNVHDLRDISLYTQNSQNKDCMSTFVCVAEEVSQTQSVAGGSGSGTVVALPPQISDVNAQLSCEQVNITWKTSLDSLTWIKYGELDQYNNEYKSETYKANNVFSTYSTDHSFSLTDLPYDTTYSYLVKSMSPAGKGLTSEVFTFTTPTAEQCGQVLGEKITEEEEQPSTCSYLEPDQDVLGQTQWADGTLLRGCDGPEVYIIENQTKRHISGLTELLNYIGQRIYNVTSDILNLF